MELTSRPFKNLDQQIDILRQKGMLIENDDYAKNVLSKIGYYTLINGYKGLFLRKNDRGNIINPHQYINGTRIEDIVSLYQFDKKLRAILYNGLLSYETILNSELAYRFSEMFPVEYSYLDINNFKHDSDNTVRVLKTISSLTTKIEQEAHKRGRNAIKHYIDSHTCIPLWVVTEFMTFGDLNYFYLNCKDELRQKIARDFTLKYRKTNDLSQSNAITPEVIEHINHVTNMFRNAVAHNEITYSKVINRGPNLSSVRNILDQYDLRLNSQPGVFELILSLRLVLDQAEYVEIANAIKQLLRDGKEQFNPDTMSNILNSMHFPEEYEFWL